MVRVFGMVRSMSGECLNRRICLWPQKDSRRGMHGNRVYMMRI